MKIYHKLTHKILFTSTYSSLVGADLYGANLRDADLYGADLYGADLRGANLHGADLRGANLHDADLRGANLHDADLRGANLHGADLRGANLYGAQGLINAGTDSRGYLFLGCYYNKETYVSAGCRWFTLKKAKIHWKENHLHDIYLHEECLARIQVIKIVAEGLGWSK